MDLYKIYSTALRKFVMTSREIVIDLIDKGLITGEQAFTLINDIVAAEIKEALEIIEKSKKNQGNGLQWINVNNEPWTISTSPTWTYSPTITASSGTTGDTYATSDSVQTALQTLQANANTYSVKSV